MNRNAITAVAIIAAFAGAAAAGPVTATFTADNHYAIYSRSGDTFTFAGGNELGPSGSVGSYNWSAAETFNFDAEGYVYIAAWSDNAVAQGLIGQLTTSAETILSGDSRWEVLSTGEDRGDWDPYPTAGEMSSWVLNGDANDAWEVPHVGGANGISPWNTIADVSSSAHWMWRDIEGVNPLQGGASHGELLVFRIPVSAIPAPGPIALAGLGGLFLTRRRRN